MELKNYTVKFLLYQNLFTSDDEIAQHRKVFIQIDNDDCIARIRSSVLFTNTHDILPQIPGLVHSCAILTPRDATITMLIIYKIILLFIYHKLKFIILCTGGVEEEDVEVDITTLEPITAFISR